MSRRGSWRKPKTRRKVIERNLKRALLEDGPLVEALYEYELAEHVEEYRLSKRTDGDDYLLAVTEHANDVAMLLIDEHDVLHVNEDARAMLKRLWRDAYMHNLHLLIPDMARGLDAGYLYAAGIKAVSEK